MCHRQWGKRAAQNARSASSCWEQACYTGPPDTVLGCSNVWHMCALNEQPQRTDQNFMQDKLEEQSVLRIYKHGTVAGTTLVRCLHSVSNAPALHVGGASTDLDTSNLCSLWACERTTRGTNALRDKALDTSDISSHHCMYEASVLILLVVYYMATHSDTLKDTCSYINSLSN